MSRFESVTWDKVVFPREFNDLLGNVTFSKRDKWVQSVTKVVGLGSCEKGDGPQCRVEGGKWRRHRPGQEPHGHAGFLARHINRNWEWPGGEVG
jgi:hypothetical protein